MDVQRISCSCRHSDDAAFRLETCAIFVLPFGELSQARRRGAERRVGCEDSIHANETRNWRERTVMMGDESSANRPRVDDPTPPDPGGARSSSAGIPVPSTLVATSSSSVDTSGENVTADMSRIKNLTLKISGIDDLRIAAANRLVKAGVSSIVLEPLIYSGGRTYAFKIGHDSAGQHVLE